MDSNHAYLYKIRFLKDTKLTKVGDITHCSKKSAESAVSQGYAEYVEKTKKASEYISEIAKLLEKLFVNRDDVYAEAYLSKDKTRMAYAKKEGLINHNLMTLHIEGSKVLGVYQLKGTKLKWGCLDFDLNTPEDFANAKKVYDLSKSSLIFHKAHLPFYTIL